MFYFELLNFQTMESLVQECKDDQDFNKALSMIQLSKTGKIHLAECFIILTEKFLDGFGYVNDKYLWLYSLPFIHFFGGKQTAEWVPKNLGHRQFNISSDNMTHLLRIDQHFSYAFLRNMEFQNLAKKIINKSDSIYNIDILKLLEKMMTGKKRFSLKEYRFLGSL